MLKINHYLLLFIAICSISCVGRKEITYFQPSGKEADSTRMDIKEKFIARIQPGDVLNIMVSTMSKESNDMLNLYRESLTQITQPNIQIPAVGFLVDPDGAITLPLTGKILVSGLNSKEASDVIAARMDHYVVKPVVSVRIVNFKVSVLGEVSRPSVYTISNERVTLPEALSLAGDLTIFGNRKNVLLIRETDGKREFSRVDLTKRDLFNSPYYYLRPNDIVYVEPSKGKIISTDRAVQLTPIIISALSLLILSISVLKYK
jgi:polysaccharide export outer membrane protein